MTSRPPRITSLALFYSDQLCPLPHKMKYRLVFNEAKGTYNSGVDFDPETKRFATAPPRDSQDVIDLARKLDGPAQSVGRVYCFGKGSTRPRGCATGFFFMSNKYILTTADLLDNDKGERANPVDLSFLFSMKSIAKKYDEVLAFGVVDVSYVHHTRGLILLRTSAPVADVTAFTPNKAYVMGRAYQPSNTDPVYLKDSAIGIIAYCGEVTLDIVMRDYEALPSEVRSRIRPPVESDLACFPVEQRALYPGQLINVHPEHNGLLIVSASLHHGCCGGPVIVARGDPTKFIGVVFGGDLDANNNTFLSVEANDFDQLFMRME